MAIVPRRLRHERKGFRARMSSGYFAIDEDTQSPLAGPFRKKSIARAECNRLQEIKDMASKPDKLEDEGTNSDADNYDDDFDGLADDDDEDDDDDQGEDEGE